MATTKVKDNDATLIVKKSEVHDTLPDVGLQEADQDALVANAKRKERVAEIRKANAKRAEEIRRKEQKESGFYLG